MFFAGITKATHLYQAPHTAHQRHRHYQRRPSRLPHRNGSTLPRPCPLIPHDFVHVALHLLRPTTATQIGMCDAGQEKVVLAIGDLVVVLLEALCNVGGIPCVGSGVAERDVGLESPSLGSVSNCHAWNLGADGRQGATLGAKVSPG